MNYSDANEKLSSRDGDLLQSLKVYRSIRQLLARIGEPDFVIVIEEGRSRQYSFPGVLESGVLLVIERPGEPLVRMVF